MRSGSRSTASVRWSIRSCSRLVRRELVTTRPSAAHGKGRAPAGARPRHGRGVRERIRAEREPLSQRVRFSAAQSFFGAGVTGAGAAGLVVSAGFAGAGLTTGAAGGGPAGLAG